MSQVRKLFAALLALSLPLAALAQASTPAPAPEAKAEAPKPLFTVYGTLNVNTQWTKTQDISDRLAVSIDSSNIGIRGALDLGRGLSATYQCETGANIDGIAGAALCNRNSRLGLAGSFGTLWYGNWDSPFKAGMYGTKAEDPFGNTDVFGYQSILGSPGFNYRSGGWKVATNTAIGGFDLRANNSIGYWTPKFSGLSAKVQYGVNEFEDASGVISPQFLAGVVNYDMGPFSVLATAEYHEDAFGLNTANPAADTGRFGATAANPTTVSSKDWAWRVAAGYQLDSPAGATTVSGAFEQLTLDQENAAAGAVSEYQRFAWQVGLKHRYGNHELRARYSMADAGDCELVGGGACDTDEYGASDIAVGYAYYLGKTTQVYAYYTTIRNDDNAQYTFSIGGSPAVAGATPPGQDPQAVGLGMRYSF